jgi:hypothetical protein
MNHCDTFAVICAFLGPRELAALLHVDRTREKWCRKYLLERKHTAHLEEFACPICGWWLPSPLRQVMLWDGFFDVFNDQEARQRMTIIKENIFCQTPSQRCLLVCEDCEYLEQPERPQLSFKGSRQYFFFLHPEREGTRQFAIMYQFYENMVWWNELRMENVEMLEYL